MKELYIPHLPQLEKIPMEEAESFLQSFGEMGLLDCANWGEFPIKPEVRFFTAHTKKALFLSFTVRGNFTLARFEEDQSPVYRDSCVEFFCRKQGNDFYTNLEFNCIGACLGAKQKARDMEKIPFTVKELSGIRRYASLGKKAFGEKRGEGCWSLAVRIPFSILDLAEDDLSSGLYANFYQCCDDAPEKHYLSWNPIRTEKPDFHRPEFFGRLIFLA